MAQGSLSFQEGLLSDAADADNEDYNVGFVAANFLNSAPKEAARGWKPAGSETAQQDYEQTRAEEDARKTAGLDREKLLRSGMTSDEVDRYIQEREGNPLAVPVGEVAGKVSKYLDEQDKRSKNVERQKQGLAPLPTNEVTLPDQQITAGPEAAPADQPGSLTLPEQTITPSAKPPASSAPQAPAGPKGPLDGPYTAKAQATLDLMDLDRMRQGDQEATDRVLNALKAAQEANKVAAEKGAARQSEDALKAQVFNERLEAEHRARQQQAEHAEKSLMAEADAIANQKLDPNHYWTEMGTFGAVMSAIAIAVGGYVNIKTMGRVPNAALETVNKNIDRDIDAQKFNMQNRREAFKAKEGIYGRMLQRFGNEDMAANASRVVYYDQLAKQTAAFKATLDLPVQQANADLVIAHFEQKAQEAKNKFLADRAAIRTHYMQTRRAEDRAAAAAARAAALRGPLYQDPVTKEMQTAKDVGDAADKFGKDWKDIVNAESALAPLIQVAEKGDTSGLGRFKPDADGLFGWTLSDEGVSNQQALETAVGAYLKMQSGASATDVEKKAKVREIIGDGSKKAIQRGVSRLITDIEARKKVVESSHGDNAVAAFRDRQKRREDVDPTIKTTDPPPAKKK